MKSNDREKDLWNNIYSDYQAVDLRNTILTVEQGFDNVLWNFGGIILSNVLDVMPENADDCVLQKLDRVLAPGGYWFIKLNPYYSEKDMKMLDYQKMEDHLYGEDGILRLHQETTEHWKRVLGPYGRVV